jgi:hypothetical protein
LQSSYEESGWLVPTHPAIKNEERRILRDKILFSGCKCPPCHLTIQTSSSSNLSLSDLDTIQGIMGLNCLPGFRPTHCKAKKDIDSCLKLSSPGPQYLVFLEKYSWEIVTRHSMSSLSPSTSTSNEESQTSTAAPSPIGTSSSNTTAASPPDIPTEISEEENDEREREREEREKRQAMFEFMVGNYCVRRFLDSAEKALSSFSSTTTTPPNATNPSSPQTQLSKLSAKLRKRLRKSKQRVQVIEVDVESEVEEVILDQEREGEEGEVVVEVREMPQPRRMMFGEIPPSSLPLPSSNSDEKPLIAPSRKHGEEWEDGLFWYYRLHLHQPFLSFKPDFDLDFDSGDNEKDARNGEEQEVGGEVDDEKTDRRHRGCFAVVRKGFGILSRRMETLFSNRCLGGMRGMRVGGKGFRALEG